jgi:hypothetical protein
MLVFNDSKGAGQCLLGIDKDGSLLEMPARGGSVGDKAAEALRRESASAYLLEKMPVASDYLPPDLRPARRGGKHQCVGATAAYDSSKQELKVFRVWSDGRVEQYKRTMPGWVDIETGL